MFNRFWRTYPWGLQLALFMLAVFTLSSFATYLVLLLVPKATGVSFNDLVHLSPGSTPKATGAALLAQAMSHIGTFAAPALLFAGFTHPRLREYLGLRAPGKPVHWLLVTGIMLGLIPVFLWGEGWMTQHLHFGQWADRMQAENDNTIQAFLKLNTGADFLLLLAVLAALPALGEELLFRGVLLRLMHRRISRTLPALVIGNKVITPDVQRSMVFPVIFTALLFSAIHFNPYGFAFIFIAGCILALIYFLTGSLLCSMWAHFLYNGTQVAAVFFSQRNKAMQQIANGDNLPVLYPLAGFIIFALCFYWLVKKQTPLPADWSDDFKEERADGSVV